jgi:small-conductance mechanosensitive channel
MMNLMFANIDMNRLIQSVQIILITISAGFTVKVIFKKVLSKLAEKTKIKLDDEIIDLLENPTFITVLLYGTRIGLRSYLNQAQNLTTLENIFYTLITIIWGWSIAKIINHFYYTLEERSSREKKVKNNLFTLLENITTVLILITQIIIVLSIWEINTTPLLTSAGIISVVIGFAAKDTIANFFGGVSVFFDQPYKIGDYVIVKDEYRGKVTNIGMRSTKIKTRDNILVTVPNSVMVTDFVINETGFDSKLRIRIPLGVAYETDLDQAEQVILQVLKSSSDILPKPQPRILFREFGPSSIKLEAIGTIRKPSRKGQIVHNLIKKIHKKLKKEDIKIPNPQRDVHLYKE